VAVDVISFEDALQEASEIHTTRHLLLGNGFSRACRNDLFAYDALIQQADFSSLGVDAWAAFDALGTSDFEVVMRALRNAVALLEIYSADAALRERLQADAEALKEILVQTIAQSHPDHPFEIEDYEYAACRTFLRHFRRIYTLNYDLLLYWAAMRSEIGEPLEFDDGFRASEEEAEYVVWEPANTRHQNVFYLHGGLHIFDGGSETQKYTWSRTGTRLIDQIRVAMDEGLFPVFVSESDSDAKLNRIRHHGYLSKGERSLVELGTTLFVFGFAMSAEDGHILRFLDANRVKGLFVSLFGDPESAANQKIVARAHSLTQRARQERDLVVRFFDAESAKVWG
jgi:Domain of unknown function (DUF4917)